ncbi:MAG: hypothetical protein JW910_09035, partial [Anaerolineae bacterium]|nr:hypothetical protein [Anaerolineae bacterium]
MPSALETLVKILKLEREQGYKNTAVIGGLGAFAGNWQVDAHAQARRPEHHDLVEELAGLMREYEVISDRHKRHKAVGYMMDRITGRVAPRDPSAPEDESGSEAPPIERPPRRGERRSRRDRPRAVAPRPVEPSPPPPPPPAPPARPQPPVDVRDVDEEDEDGFDEAPLPEAHVPSDEPARPKPRRKPGAPLPFDEAAERLRGLNAPVT